MTGSLDVRLQGGGLRHHAVRAAALIAVTAAACGSDGARDRSLAEARAEGLRVGFAIEPPFAFVDPTGGMRGEGPQIVRHLASTLDIDSLQWFPLEFQNLIPALEDGRIDVIASGLFITDDRRGTVRFSRPKACLAPALVVRDDGVSEVAFACDTCSVAVIRGSVEERALRAAGVTRAQRAEPTASPAGAEEGGASLRMILAPDVSTAIAAVKSRDAAALAISAPSARVIVARDSSLVLHDTIPAGLNAARGCAALAFRPADRSLADAFDAMLAEFVGSDAHQAMVEPYGFTEPEIACAMDAAGEDAYAASC